MTHARVCENENNGGSDSDSDILLGAELINITSKSISTSTSIGFMNKHKLSNFFSLDEYQYMTLMSQTHKRILLDIKSSAANLLLSTVCVLFSKSSFSNMTNKRILLILFPFNNL